MEKIDEKKETLIFVEERDFSSIRQDSRKLRYLKKGGISDALAHFDDTYPSFYYEKGMEGFSEEYGGDPYYLDDQGGLIICGDGEAFFSLGEKRIFVSDVNFLSKEELVAVYESDGDSAIDIFIRNGISCHDFKLIHGFGIFHEIFNNDFNIKTMDWFSEDVTIHTEDPEDDYIGDYPVVYKGGLYYTYKSRKNEQ